MTLIGLCGYTRTGKDTIAKTLKCYGFSRVAFADAMRQDLYTLDPVIDSVWRLSRIVDTIGWDAAKEEYPEVRRLLQVYGSEVGRDGYGDRVWIDRAIPKIKAAPKCVVTDVRFLNEVSELASMGAVFVHVTRPGRGPINGHNSEQLDYSKVAPKYHICNNGTFRDLENSTLRVLKDLL